MAAPKSNEQIVIVDYRPTDKIAVISLNRPSKMNALTFEMFGLIEKSFETLLADPEKDVRAIVLTSTSQHFTAGLDLNSAMQIGSIPAGETVDTSRIALGM